MSREPSRDRHWKAEEYDWDPHLLQAARSRAFKPEQPDNESEVTQTEEPLPGDAAAPPIFNPIPTAGGASSQERSLQAERLRGAPAGSARDGSPAERSSGSAEQRSTEDTPTSRGQAVPVVKDTLASVHGPSKKRIPLQCQVDGCQKDLSKEKEYYQRYRICEDHLKLSSLLKDGIEQRFCQQCGRFHVLADFDADKRSCRARLNLHNDRRRKRVPDQSTPRQDLQNPQPRGRRTRTRRKRLPYGEQAGSEDLDALDAETAAADSAARMETRQSWRGSRQEGEESEGQRQDPRVFQPPWGLMPAYRGYPVEMTAALQGLHGIPALSTCLPGSVVDERYLGSPMPSFTHHSHPSLRPPEVGSPLSLPYASQLAGEADMQALELAWRQQSAHLKTMSEQDPGRLRALRDESQAGLYKSASEPTYGPLSSTAMQAPWNLQASTSAPEDGGRTRSDGAASPLKEFQLASLRFRTGGAQDFWYEQQAQLLRDSSWGASRDESQRQQLQQAAADLDMSTYNLPSSSIRRHASSSPTVENAQRIQAGASMLAPRVMPGDGSLISRFSSDRGSIAQLLSGGSESSMSQFHPLNTQESANSRQGGGGHLPSRFAVSEAAASLRRINSGSTRLERGLTGQQRLVSSSSPLGPSPHGATGSSRRSTDDLLQHPPAAQSRYSDPGSWSQQYQGFLGEGRRSFDHSDPERLQLSRSGVKLRDLGPERLNPGVRENYLQLIGAPEAAHLEASIRPGCTHIVATALTQGCGGTGIEAAERLIGDGGPFGCAEMLVQLPESMTYYKNGRLQGWLNGAENAALQPPRPSPLRCSVVSGGSLPVRVTPQARGVEALRLLGRCNGAFLVDMQVDDSDPEIGLPEGTSDGVLWLETELMGVLSEPAPVVLTSNPDIAEEVQSLKQAARVQSMSVTDIESLVVDIGMVLQYAGHLSAGHSGTQPLGGGFPPSGCCRVVHSDKGQPKMCTTGYLHYITDAARRVAALCCREGWPALAAKVLPVAGVGLGSWTDLVSKLEQLLGERLLLHAAVSSGSHSMVLLILDLFALFQLECSVAGSFQGATALHVAAGLPDGGETSQLLLQRCSAARRLWNSARDAQGRAPADIAYITNRRQEGAKGSGSWALANLERGDAGTPPETPRLGDALLTARGPVPPAPMTARWQDAGSTLPRSVFQSSATISPGSRSRLSVQSPARPAAEAQPVPSDPQPMELVDAPRGQQTVSPDSMLREPHDISATLIARCSWPGPHAELSAALQPLVSNDKEKLLTWPPLTRDELAAKAKLCRNSAAPMVIELRADSGVGTFNIDQQPSSETRL